MRNYLLLTPGPLSTSETVKPCYRIGVPGIKITMKE